MPRPALELADIFRQHGPAYRQTHDLPWHQQRLMRAIENCRTPALGGVVEWCGHCQYTHIQYRSCRNRHCPKCQGAARQRWLEQRRAELLPTDYFHLVFTLPKPIAALAFYNKEVVYDLLFRRLLLEALEKAYAQGQLHFFSDLEPLGDPQVFARYLAPLRKSKWVVYAKAPFGGPQHVLEYLGRYTHRVAISNRRLLALEDGQVSFQWKDYRDGQQQKVMTVSAEEFIRRFLQHTLPPGFQRIRYYGLLANCHRAEKLDLCRRLLATGCTDLLAQPAHCRGFSAALTASHFKLCPRCGRGTLTSIQFLWPGLGSASVRIDSS